jgi:hypothetical protein
VLYFSNICGVTSAASGILSAHFAHIFFAPIFVEGRALAVEWVFVVTFFFCCLSCNCKLQVPRLAPRLFEIMDVQPGVL